MLIKLGCSVNSLLSIKFQSVGSPGWVGCNVIKVIEFSNLGINTLGFKISDSVTAVRAPLIDKLFYIIIENSMLQCYYSEKFLFRLVDFAFIH